MKKFAISLVISLVALLDSDKALADQSFDIHSAADGSHPAIAFDNKGQLHLALERREKTSNRVDIFYAKSADHARTWTPAVDISGQGKSSIADIVVDEKGVIDVAWGYMPPDGEAGLFLVRSLDGGKTWTKPFSISNIHGVSSEPDIAVGPDDSIHVVWTDKRAGESYPQIYYCFSKDSGVTWSNSENISNTLGAAGEAAMTVGQDGTVYAVWSEKPSGGDHADIYFALKTADEWSSGVNVSNSAYATSHPDVACGSKDKIHLCWAEASGEGNGQDIIYRTGNSRGQLRRALDLSDTPGISSNPALVADLDRVAVVWSNTNGDTNSQILGRASVDGGKKFSATVSFSNKGANSVHPDVAISGNEVFAVWQDSSPNQNVIKITSLQIAVDESKK